MTGGCACLAGRGCPAVEFVCRGYCCRARLAAHWGQHKPACLGLELEAQAGAEAAATAAAARPAASAATAAQYMPCPASLPGATGAFKQVA